MSKWRLTVPVVYPVFSTQDFGRIGKCLRALFGLLRARWSRGWPVAYGLEWERVGLVSGMLTRARVPWRLRLWAHFFSNELRFFSQWKKKKSTRKPWQVFPACWSCGFVLLTEFLTDYSRAAVTIDQMRIGKQPWVRLCGAMTGIWWPIRTFLCLTKDFFFLINIKDLAQVLPSSASPSLMKV